MGLLYCFYGIINLYLFKSKIMLKLTKQTYVLGFLAISLIANNAFASTQMCEGIEQKKETILAWLIKEQGLKNVQITMPNAVAYKNVTVEDKKLYCDWCPAEPNPQLNMFITKKNEIWLADNVREDQLAHELSHALQSSQNAGEGSEASDDLENQAVHWQNKYKEAFPVRQLCE